MCGCKSHTSLAPKQRNYPFRAGNSSVSFCEAEAWQISGKSSGGGGAVWVIFRPGIPALRLPVDEKPLAGKLVIVKAVYGDVATNEVLDVTAQVAAMVKDNALKVVASNENFDDPAVGAYKPLRVHYTIGGAGRTRTVGEDRTPTISGNGR